MENTVEAKERKGNEEYGLLFVQDLPLWNKYSFCSILPIGQWKL